MQGRRLVLKHLLVYFLLGSLFGVAPGAAQDTPAESVPLRLVHGGDFLPRGTTLVVLGDRSENEPGSSLQPRFLAPDAYPLQAASVMRHDTLDAGGFTRARYPTTKTTGVRYFIYARTPDETVYWSYSALKDSIKYDTIDRGVMAVAPIHDPAVRQQIVRTFFEGAPAPVFADADTTAPLSADADTTAPAPPTTPRQATLPEATTPATERAGAPFWVYIVLAFALACIAGLLLLTVHYRTQLAIKTEPDTDPLRFNAADWHPDRRVGLEQELNEIKTNYEGLKKTYNVLLNRHKTLIREVQKLHQGTEQAPQETPTQRFSQDPPKAGS